jgi:CxxC motif-containing protein (DUF1111 family)
MTKFAFPIGSLILFSSLLACQKMEPAPPAADQVMDAPIEGLSPAQNRIFLQGAAEFDEVYTASTGLGPTFVSNSCSSCHSGDNRGHLFTAITRYGQTTPGTNPYASLGGPQLQPLSIAGFHAEELPSDVSSSKFLAPIAAGVGFLEAIDDATILSWADETDANGDGISGVPNWVNIPSWVVPNDNSVVNNGKYIGRFGRKGSTYNLHQQTVNAFHQDMGITSTFIPFELYNPIEPMFAAPSQTPEVSDAGVSATVFYLQVLQTPFQRNVDDAEVKKGLQVFQSIGCNNCHKETVNTGFSPIAQLSFQTIHPYTDLLLHDMGEALNDNYTEGSALNTEWKTPALWGLGLAPNVQGNGYFLMHDGRAHSIEEAILYHGGEGQNSSNQFQQLSQTDQEALIKFLKSL